MVIIPLPPATSSPTLPFPTMQVIPHPLPGGWGKPGRKSGHSDCVQGAVRLFISSSPPKPPQIDTLSAKTVGVFHISSSSQGTSWRPGPLWTCIDGLGVVISGPILHAIPMPWGREMSVVTGDRRQEGREAEREPCLEPSAAPPREGTRMTISVHTTTHAQIAEPLFCNFHNEDFGIIIKLKGKGRRTGPRELRTALPGPPCPALRPHNIK